MIQCYTPYQGLMDDKAIAKAFRQFSDRCEALNSRLSALDAERKRLESSVLDSLLEGDTILNLRRESAALIREEIQLRQEMAEWATSLLAIQKERLRDAIESVGRAEEQAELNLRGIGYLNPATDGDRFRPGMFVYFQGAILAAPGVRIAKGKVDALKAVPDAMRDWLSLNSQAITNAEQRMESARKAVLKGV